MNIHCLQHVAFEGPAAVEAWAARNGHAWSPTRLFAGEGLPALEDVDWLVVLGGPMNIYEEDRYPWLAAEKRYLRQAVEQDKTVSASA